MYTLSANGNVSKPVVDRGDVMDRVAVMERDIEHRERRGDGADRILPIHSVICCGHNTAR